MGFLKEELRKRPPEPSASSHRRRNPDPWLQSYLDNIRSERDMVNEAISADERKRIGLNVTFAATLTKKERRLNGDLSKRLDQFRRRLAVTDASVARFVVGGTTDRYSGRFPGIPEEVMLSLAQAKPIYLAGAFGGATTDIGSLLGLAHPRKGQIPAWLQPQPEEEASIISTIGDKLRPGPWTGLPVSSDELALFLKAHALGGPKWPKNGLTFDENLRLFDSNDCDEVADLVASGLRRRFARAETLEQATQ
jgi:hypothetical protein